MRRPGAGQNDHVLLVGEESEDDPLVTDAVTVTEVVQAVGVFVGSVLLAVVLRQVLVRAVSRQANRHLGQVLGRILSVIIIGVGIIYALDVVGVRIGPLVGALGIGGVALAFAAQDVLANLIAGVLIGIRRPIKFGEQIGTGEYEGTVEDVNLRTVEIRTYDGNTVLIPNQEVLRNPIINYTRTPYRRTELVVGLAYSTDLRRAQQVLVDAATSAPGVRPDPPPEAWVFEFGESSINIAVRYWHAADIASVWRVRSAVAMAVKEALDEAGMTIPFPQRTLWFGPGNTTLDVRQQEGDRRER